MIVHNWELRPITEMQEFEHIVDLEIKVWGLEARDAVPSNLLHAMANNGSLVLGAYTPNQCLIGLSLAFPVPRVKQNILWSHMTAVHPEYQGKGLGFELKQYQRTWGMERGYKSIGWTFDPLQRGNANFNIHVLGATSNLYHIDFYGEMTDSINAGLPSDRLEATWTLNDKNVKRLARKKDRVPLEINENTQIYTLKNNQNSNIQFTKPTGNLLKTYLAEIPADLATLKRKNSALALEWRLQLRKALIHLFSLGYSIQDLVRIDDRFYYVLERSRIWYMYVLECSDGTLYTGITPNIRNRVDMHNKGKGAHYTATRRPVKFLIAWEYLTRTHALKAERAFKDMSRNKKLTYIAQQDQFMDAPVVLETNDL